MLRHKRKYRAAEGPSGNPVDIRSRKTTSPDKLKIELFLHCFVQLIYSHIRIAEWLNLYGASAQICKLTTNSSEDECNREMPNL